MDISDQLERALERALQAHRSQRDRAGAPYILHPLHLMFQCLDDPAAMVVALLHDTVEDSTLTLEDLRADGFPADIVEAVDALTRRKHESYEAFVHRAGAHPLARRVKQADIEHNMDLRRLNTLGPADLERLQRYHRALRALLTRGDS
jgi:(p)ppGpp synthase/HD superfamily hydrolase